MFSQYSTIAFQVLSLDVNLKDGKSSVYLDLMSLT